MWLIFLLWCSTDFFYVILNSLRSVPLSIRIYFLSVVIYRWPTTIHTVSILRSRLLHRLSWLRHREQKKLEVNWFSFELRLNGTKCVKLQAPRMSNWALSGCNFETLVTVNIVHNLSSWHSHWVDSCCRQDEKNKLSFLVSNDTDYNCVFINASLTVRAVKYAKRHTYSIDQLPSFSCIDSSHITHFDADRPSLDRMALMTPRPSRRLSCTFRHANNFMMSHSEKEEIIFFATICTFDFDE